MQIKPGRDQERSRPSLIRVDIAWIWKVFGDIYSRPGLDLKIKEMITLASMATIGSAPLQVKVHINSALNVGCSEKEIIETFLQIIPSAGMVLSMNALLIAKEVFDERKVNAKK